MSHTFPYRHALVTGASRGLGRALAFELAAHGLTVGLVARPSEDLDRTLREIRAAGGRAQAIPADVGEPEAATAIAGQAQALLGPVDLVIHAASTLGPVPLRLLADTDPAEWARTYEVNVHGPFRLSRALVGPMVLRGSGALVFISSDAAVNAYPTWGAYGTSKAAQDHLARTFAAELEGTGVHALAIDPGEMDTDMHAAAMPEADRSTLARPALVARRIVERLRLPLAGSTRVEVRP